MPGPEVPAVVEKSYVIVSLADAVARTSVWMLAPSVRVTSVSVLTRAWKVPGPTYWLRDVFTTEFSDVTGLSNRMLALSPGFRVNVALASRVSVMAEGRKEAGAPEAAWMVNFSDRA